MTPQPTDLDIAALLEEQEAIAKRKAESTQNEKHSDAHDDTSAARDPRRLQRDTNGGDGSADTRPSRDRRHDRESSRPINPRYSADRYLSEREENDERRSRRSRDLANDDPSKSPSDRGSANGSVRSRPRSRSPLRADNRRGGVRDYRDRSESRDRRGGDHYSGGGRSGRYGGRRDRSPRRARSPRRGDRRVDSYRGGHGRRSPEPSKRKTPEPTDDERDRRTVFVQQLSVRLRSRQLKEFFEQAGPVVDAQIVKDRVSQRSKGVGYVEFKDEESVQKAIQLTGQKLLNIPIIAQLTEAEKNRQARNTEGATQSNGVPFHRLYVGNIHFNLGEEELREVFQPFGELEFVQLQKEEGGRSKGYGFVQYFDPLKAKAALETLNGFELLGRPIRVGLGNDKFTTESTESLKQRFGSQANSNFQGSSFSGMGGRGTHAGGSGHFDRAGVRDNDKAGGASALDDTDVTGVNFQNFNRDALMRKLARLDEPTQKTTTKAAQPKAQLEPPQPSRCVVLKNMYNQHTETEPNWQKELEEDVKSECEDKYGKVLHIGISLSNNDGEIYLKFDSVKSGENAIRGLNGRWFGGRMITADYVVEAIYYATFPKAANT